MRKKLILFSLIPIVFLAGCIFPRPPVVGNGVIIESFSPELSTIGGNQEVVVSLNVKNIGEWKATNIKTQMMGIDWSGYDRSDPSEIDELLPADPTAGFEGEEGTFDWTLTSPTAKTVDIIYEIGARVLYGYSTASETLLKVATKSYYRTIAQAEGAPTEKFGIISSKTTGGPLVVTVKTRVPYVEPGQSIRVQFEIQNVGGGRVFAGNTPEDRLDKVKSISATINGVTVPGCGGTDIRLIAGKSKVLYCDVPLGTFKNYVEKTITFYIDYNYFVDSTTSITLLKAEVEVEVITDTEGPSVSISHSPSIPKTTDEVTFRVTASDPSGIKEIVIYYNDTPTHLAELKRWPFESPYRSTEEVSITKRFDAGKYEYNATARDAYGNKATTSTATLVVLA